MTAQAHRQHLTHLHSFLKVWTDIWSLEVLDYTEKRLNEIYPQTWVEYLDQLPPEELWKIDARKMPLESIGEQSFKNFLSEIHELIQISKILPQQLDKLPTWATTSVTEKKQHEVQTLAQFFKQHPELKNLQLMDIGGGVGHLARIMGLYYGMNFTTIDQDRKLQETGLKRLNKYPHPENPGKIKFVHGVLPTITSQEELAKSESRHLFCEHDFSIGLHTCGPLAVSHLKMAIEAQQKGVLNFGCCYYKMCHHQDTHLSEHARSIPLDFTPFGLTLATRGHDEMSWNKYLLKERVKAFRYAIHLYLNEELGVNHIRSVGDSRPREYWGEFGPYAQAKLAKFDFPSTQSSKLTATQLQKYFDSSITQKRIRKMYLQNIIRWRLGRPLELYLLRDRAAYLEENGKKSYVLEFFEEKLSPRNIGVFGVDEEKVPKTKFFI